MRRRPSPTQEIETPSKAGFKKWYVYIVGAITVFLIVVLLLKGGEEKKETPPPPVAAPVQPPVSAPVASTVERGGTEGATGALEPAKKNYLPEITSVRLSPKIVFPGTVIKGEVEASDKDGDSVTFNYEWRRNGVVVDGAVSDELDTKGLKKGDLIVLFVTPFDGKEKGRVRRPRAVTINNRPPEIVSAPSTSISNGRYSYEVKAIDLDGDKLIYSIENAPAGMTIDAGKGVIQWDVPPTAGVGYSFTIVVSDGDAKAFQGLTLNPVVENR
ncbi:MAG: putative Ig domain-containing protein [Deltaproteobacteria bacterium]|nr:putative Ig domain-containing protein [Deltaproteobacteria bacterium]